jgi:hypothetical protein
MNLNILSFIKNLGSTQKLTGLNPHKNVKLVSFHTTSITFNEKSKIQLENEINKNLFGEVEVKRQIKLSSSLNRKIVKKEEKNTIRLSRLRKKLVRKWRWNKSKLSRLDFKFRVNVLTKIYKQIKAINRSKMKSRLRSNIVSKLGRFINYFQYYNIKSVNKVSSILSDYNYMLLIKKIKENQTKLTALKKLNTLNFADKLLNVSLKKSKKDRNNVTSFDQLWTQEKSSLVQNYNIANINKLNLEGNICNIKTDETKEGTKPYSELNFTKTLPLSKNKIKLSLFLYHTYLKIQYSKNMERIKYLSKTLSYFETVKGFMGRSINYNNQLLYHSKLITYNFSNINSKFNILGGNNYIENLLKDLFYVVSSIISKPIFIIRQDKLIIRLFLFLSPKISNKLNTSLNNKKQNYKFSNKLRNSKNPLISKNFKERYWNNLNQIKLMSYNSSLNQLGLKNEIKGSDVLEFSHTGDLLLENSSIDSMKNRNSILLHKNYLINREYFIKTNYKNYSAYLQLVLSQLYFSYFYPKTNKIPLISRPVHYKNNTDEKLVINKIKSSFLKLQNYLIFKRCNVILNSNNQKRNKYNKFNLLNRIKFFLFEKKNLSSRSLNWAQTKNRQMFNHKNMSSVVTIFKGKNKYNKKTLNKLNKLSFSNFINWPLTESQIKIYTQFFNKINSKANLISLNTDNSSMTSNFNLLKSLQRRDHILLKNVTLGKLEIPNIKELNRKKSVVSFFTLFKNRLNKIVKLLSKILNIKVELEVVKVETPFQDSSMISQILGYNSKKWYFYRMWRTLLPKIGIQNPTQNLNYTIEKKEEDIERKLKGIIYEPTSYLPPLFNKNKLNSKFIGFKTINSNHNLSSYVSGISMKLAGRLMTQKMRPRFTVQMKQNGSLARVKVDYTEKSRYTSKNKRGAFSFTISIGHIIK